MMNFHKTSMFSLLVCVLIGVAGAQALEPPESPESPATDQSGNKFPLPETSGDPAQEAPATTGRLAIQAKQGTPGGPAIAEAEVEVDLYHNKTVIKTIKTSLDEYGVVVIDDIPISQGVIPVVKVAHADVTYQEVGTMMDPTQPQQKIEVMVYEVTSTPPQWRIGIRQVMITHAPEGIKVTEVVVVDNPEKETWLGVPQDEGEPVTTAFSLPRGVEQVTLGTGFHDWCCTTLSDGLLTNHLPLMPHITEMNLSYVVPARDGSVDLSVSAPASIEQMIVIVPDDIGVDEFNGLELGGSSKIADTPIRYYTAKNLTAGQTVSVSLSNLSQAAPVANSVPVRPGQEPQSLAKTVSLIGGGLLLLAAVVLVFIKARPIAEV
jgi:hypothetical protein